LWVLQKRSKAKRHKRRGGGKAVGGERRVACCRRKKEKGVFQGGRGNHLAPVVTKDVKKEGDGGGMGVGRGIGKKKVSFFVDGGENTKKI